MAASLGNNNLRRPGLPSSSVRFSEHNHNIFADSSDDEDDGEERALEQALSNRHGEASEADPGTTTGMTEEEIAAQYNSSRPKKQSRPRDLLTVERLTGPQGLIRIPDFKKSVRFPNNKTKNPIEAAATYLRSLMRAYEGVTQDLDPDLALDDAVAKISKLGSKGPVKEYLTHMREGVRNQYVERLYGKEKADVLLGQLDFGMHQQQYNDGDDKEPEAGGFADDAQVTEASPTPTRTTESTLERTITTRGDAVAQVTPSVAVRDDVVDTTHVEDDDDDEQEATLDDVEGVPSLEATETTKMNVEDDEEAVLESMQHNSSTDAKNGQKRKRLVVDDEDDEDDFPDSESQAKTCETKTFLDNHDEKLLEDEGGSVASPTLTRKKQRRVVDDDESDHDAQATTKMSSPIARALAAASPLNSQASLSPMPPHSQLCASSPLKTRPALQSLVVPLQQAASQEEDEAATGLTATLTAGQAAFSSDDESVA